MLELELKPLSWKGPQASRGDESGNKWFDCSVSAMIEVGPKDSGSICEEHLAQGKGMRSKKWEG